MRTTCLSLVTGLAVLLSLGASATTPAAESSVPPAAEAADQQIWQYFVAPPDAKPNATSGAYLWIPPQTTAIRAVMVGVHNGLPLPIMQHPAVRAVCRKHGIAQILLTPNGSDIANMVKGLNFDPTDTDKTAIYDRYLADLARVSEHPELEAAPIVPLAHSAYMSFPFEAALRKPEQCLGIIPIKAGTPNVYAYLDKMKVPNPALCLRYVPGLILDSAGQETVPGRWKGSPYPQVFEPNFINAYRQDRQDNPGTEYQAKNEMIGGCWDMLSGHFDLHERNYVFVADWLEAIAVARLPAQAGAPLKNLTLKDGWLMDPRPPKDGKPGKDYAQPAPYLQYTGNRSKALWYPTEALARRALQVQLDACTKDIEVFTVLDPQGQPIAMPEGPMAKMPDPTALLHGDGRFTITTHHFTAPPEICTSTEKDHGKKPDATHTLGNPLFPGKTVLPVSDLPLVVDGSGTPFQVLGRTTVKDDRGVTETKFDLRLARNRVSTGSQQLLFLRLKHGGDDRFLPTGRTVEISWWYGGMKGGKGQTITFPTVADAPASAAKVALKATSSAGLPVDYFVVQGPGIIQGSDFVVREVPAGRKAPILVTIGAYHNGVYDEGKRVAASDVAYQSFKLLPGK